MSGRPHFVRRHAWSLAGALATALLVPAFEWSALAAPPHEEEEVDRPRQSSSGQHTPESLVNLNHMSTPWTKVLQHLADGTHSTLVMHDAPPGRFSRHDWRKHTRTEAVRILNRDLEKLGYRILEKGQFLTVIEVQQAHVDYERPVVGERRAPVVVQDQSPSESAPEEPTDEIRVVQHERPIPARPAASRVTTIQPARSTNDQRVVQIQHLDADEDPAPPSQPRVTTPQAETETPEALTSVTIKPTKRRAADIAKQIHTVYGDRSQLADAGPHDLPAFIVSEARDKDAPDSGHPLRPQFTIEIDADRNELILTAGADRVASLESLIRALDKVPQARGQKQELVAGNAAAVAEKLQPQLSELVANKPAGAAKAPKRRSPALAQGEGEPKAETPAVGSPEELFNRGSKSTTEAEGPQPGAMSEAGPDSESPQDSLPALLDTLKGDVSLESMPDLDLLILRGNEKDVEAVMKVIRTIEQMAEGSTPEIHLRRLEHVDSQSLATLLTSVYERMTTLRSTTAQKSEAQIAVIPVVTPNAVLILAPANALESVLQLTEELDKEVDPQHQVEVFPLEFAIASQVVTTIEDFYPTDATARPGLSARIRISADTRTNSVIVQAQPRDMEEVRSVLKKIDRDEAGSAVQAKIIKLKSANAEELATFLQGALSSILTGQTTTGQGGGGGGGQNSQQLLETKSVVLEFLNHDQSAQELIRSGLLTDVRVNADPRTNSLMVTAPKQSMILMEALVNVLDQPSSALADIKIFQLKNADAADAVTLLETLFTEDANTQNGAIGVQLAGATDAGSNLVPMKFSTDGRTNSVIAIGGADALRIVEAVLLRLDDNDARTRKPTVVKLKNSSAEDVSLALNQFLQSQRELAQLDPDRISSSQLLEQEVIVTPELLSNSLIISATPRYFDEIMSLVNELDREQQQVSIQALLVEVTLEDNDEFGVELGFQDSLLFDRSVIDNILTIPVTNTAPNGVQTTTNTIISQSATPGFPFNNLPLGNNTSVKPGRVGSQGLSNFALGRTNGDLGYGGLVLSASSDSVNVLIRALASRRNVRVLSRPSVTVLDSQIAEIQVGQVVPVTDGATIGTAGNVIPTITRDNAGIILTVTPRISLEGQVVMEIAAEKSEYTGAGVTILTDANGRDVTSPIKEITTASTTVKVPDSQTIVLGGMITNTDDTVERKVPWLGDIPLIGAAFRYDSHAHRRTELLIFLTPRVIRCDQDSEHIKQIEAQRIHFFEDEAELIHGPLFAIPGESGPVAEPTWEATMQPLPLTPEAVPAPTLAPTLAPAQNFENPSSQQIQQMRGESIEPASSKPVVKPRHFFKKSSKAVR